MKIKKILAISALLLGGIVAGLILCEVIVRLIDVKSSSMDWLAHHRLSTNPNLLYEHVPNTHTDIDGIHYRINKQGFRGADWTEQKENKILIVGDSVVFSDGVEENNTFWSLLNEKLQEHNNAGRPVKAMGVGGYNTYQEKELIRLYISDIKPDLTMLIFCLNDVDNPYDHMHLPYNIEIPEAVVPNPSHSEEGIKRSKSFKNIVDYYGNSYSHFYKYYLSKINFMIQHLLCKIRPCGEEKFKQWESCLKALSNINSPEWQWLRGQFKDIKKISGKHKSKIVVVIIPFEYQFDENYPLASMPQKNISDYLISIDIPVLDLTPHFQKGHEKYYLDAVHLSDSGHQLMSNVILNYIERNKLLPNSAGAHQ